LKTKKNEKSKANSKKCKQTKKEANKKEENVEFNNLIKKHNLDKKCERGTHVVTHEVNSEINYITVVDSKNVSIISTASGVTPRSKVERLQKNKKQKVAIEFPSVFLIYNMFMGGVDFHDQHCSDFRPTIHGKKWT